MTFKKENRLNLYNFHKNNISVANVLEPTSDAYLNYEVESLNKKYVIISETEWRMYSSGGIIKATLNFNSSGSFFIFTLIPTGDD